MKNMTVFHPRVLQLLLNSNFIPSSLTPFTMMMEAIRSSETSVLTRVTRRRITGNGIIQTGLFQCISIGTSTTSSSVRDEFVTYQHCTCARVM
jgi:hypothetical protein